MTDSEEIKKRLEDLQRADAEFKRRKARDRLRQVEFSVRLSFLMHQSVHARIVGPQGEFPEPFVLTC